MLLKIFKNNVDMEYGVKYKFCDIDDKMKYIVIYLLIRYFYYEFYVGK